MATTTTSVRNLIDQQSITYIRPTNIRIDAKEIRPNCTLYIFFDDISISQYCRQIITPVYNGNPVLDDANLGEFGVFTSSATGEISIMFYLPGGKFTTGSKNITIADTKVLADLSIVGNVYGSATANFTSKGTLEIYQTTTTTVNTEYREVFVAARVDPLAQSFFTFGQKGGVFVTSIELYFQSKDAQIPVRVELRPMVNGFPSDYESPNADCVCILNPSSVSISNDASAATKFTFERPIFLPEDGDYCFVVLSNSKSYNLWTSRMGEKSIETGNIIFEQPYVGSLFRSENNYTWTAEQFEDIKFKINKAQFLTNVQSDIVMVGSAEPIAYSGENFTTKNGSDLIIFKCPMMHGLTASSKLVINCDTGAIYNGIPAVSLTGAFNISRIIDEYTLEFIAGASATVSGAISSSGIIRKIAILAGGNYSSVPTITIGAPSSGVTATATVVLTDGVITNVNITNHGSGYTTQPAISISGSGGGNLLAVTEANFAVVTNKPVNLISPQIVFTETDDSTINTVLKTTNTNYGQNTNLILDLSENKRLEFDTIIASRTNENLLMSNANSLELIINMTTTNPNVSPTIDLRRNPNLFAYSNAINNATIYEDSASVTEFATVTAITVSIGGSGYSVAPVVTIVPAENETNVNIIAATATATVSGGAVTAIAVDTPGSGYTRPPNVVIAAPASGITATANTTISTFNSELGSYGTSYSKYLTKKIKLETTSNDIRMYAAIYSTPETDVEWYIRTSLSSDITVHEDNTWRILACDTDRNKSAAIGEFFEYEFYTSTSMEFDTYDLKCILKSTNKTITPYVKRYRVIAVA